MYGPKPLIGITGPDEGGGAAWFFTALSVILAGGMPLRITPGEPEPEILHSLDGLILGGGADVEPMKYGQQRIEKTELDTNKRSLAEWILSIIFFPVYWLVRYFRHTKSSAIDTHRDALEFALLEEALEKGIPVLGICRGMQLINIHYGGTLHQDIRGFYEEKAQISSILPKKKVEIQPGSKLNTILNTQSCNVNALHNQAIDETGRDLIIAARESETGISQAIEHRKLPFVIGVQWHPEYLIQIHRQRALFKKLITQAEQQKAGEPSHESTQ